HRKKGQDPKACIWWCCAATSGLPALTPESNNTTSTRSIWMTSVPQHEVEDAVKFTHAIPQGLQLAASGHAWCDRTAPPNVKSERTVRREVFLPEGFRFIELLDLLFHGQRLAGRARRIRS